MILTNRLFTRREPERSAKSIYIFCEGKKREYQYFRYFRGIDSRINVEVYALRQDENNSPAGLYQIALDCTVRTPDNPSPKYEFLDGDEVWFVIDTDDWGSQIHELRENASNYLAWHVAQSNPCFEVWLYFHYFDGTPDFQNKENCAVWRGFVANNLPGGFDARRHPVFIEKAISSSRAHFIEIENSPQVGSTQVFRLAESIYAICKRNIDEILKKI